MQLIIPIYVQRHASKPRRKEVIKISINDENKNKAEKT